MNSHNNKQRLFEIMQKIDSTFKKRLVEEIDIDNLYLNDNEINEILKGYIDTAIWTEEEKLKESYSDHMGNSYNDEDYFDEDGESEEEIKFLRIMKTKSEKNPIRLFVRENVDHDSLIECYLDIKKFIINAGGIAVKEAIDINGYFRLGMDIWLTRNGHGSGFFDHNYENEDALTNAGRSLKSVELYLGDDDKLYFS